MTIVLNGTSGITTPGLTNDGSQTITNGTANGVAYLNGSKVLTTGSALTFDGTTLSASRGIAVNTSGTATSGFYNGVSISGYDALGWTGSNSLAFGGYRSSQWGEIIFYTSGSEQMRLTSTGLGIGTSSPSLRVDVQKSDGSGRQDLLRVLAGGNATNNGASIALGSTQTQCAYITGLQTASNEGALVFGTQSSGAYAERARITSGGDLLVGTTDPSGSSGNGAKVITSTNGAIFAQVTAQTANAGHTAFNYYSTGAGAYRFYVGAGGTVFATSTSISAISDATLKENIRDLETGLPEVMALKPRRFDWKNGDAQNVAGFVAQEVEQVLPELVADYVYNKDEDGNDIIKKSLKMGDILPTLVKAIQEQQAIITALTERVAALEAK